jgi:hypothetical protein
MLSTPTDAFSNRHASRQWRALFVGLRAEICRGNSAHRPNLLTNVSLQADSARGLHAGKFVAVAFRALKLPTLKTPFCKTYLLKTFQVSLKA